MLATTGPNRGLVPHCPRKPSQSQLKAKSKVRISLGGEPAWGSTTKCTPSSETRFALTKVKEFCSFAWQCSEPLVSAARAGPGLIPVPLSPLRPGPFLSAKRRHRCRSRNRLHFAVPHAAAGASEFGASSRLIGQPPAKSGPPRMGCEIIPGGPDLQHCTTGGSVPMLQAGIECAHAMQAATGQYISNKMPPSRNACTRWVMPSLRNSPMAALTW